MKGQRTTNKAKDQRPWNRLATVRSFFSHTFHLSFFRSFSFSLSFSLCLFRRFSLTFPVGSSCAQPSRQMDKSDPNREVDQTSLVEPRWTWRELTSFYTPCLRARGEGLYSMCERTNVSCHSRRIWSQEGLQNPHPMFLKQLYMYCKPFSSGMDSFWEGCPWGQSGQSRDFLGPLPENH